MPQPTASDVHVNRPLTSVSVSYSQQRMDFVWDTFPELSVSKQSDLYFVWDKGDLYRSEVQVRAPGTESAGMGVDLTTQSYFCQLRALHKDINDHVRANADAPLDMDRSATEQLTLQMMIKKDKDWAANFFTTGIWDIDTTPGTLWDNAASTPIEDIRTQMFTIKSNTGYWPNTLVLGARVWEALADHPEFTDRIKFGSDAASPAMVTPNLVAQLLGLESVRVAAAVENTATEGATDSYDFILGKNALLCYKAPSPGIDTPTAGYTMNWTGLVPGMDAGMAISRFRMDNLKSDRIEIESAYDFNLVAASMGTLFAAVVA